MQKKMWKIVFLALVAVLAIGMLAGCGGSTEEPVADKGQFVVGLDENFPPMGFRDENGEIVGFDVDMAREALTRMGYEPVFQPIDWNAKEMELSSGKIDAIWNGLTITDERKEQMAFSEPYLNNTQAILVLKDATYQTSADLAGQAVATQESSSAAELIAGSKELTNLFGSVDAYADYESALMDLEIGRVKAVVGDLILLSYKTASTPDKYRILDESLADEQYGVAMRLDDTERLAELQATLDEMNQDGTSAEISTKWFGSDLVLK